MLGLVDEIMCLQHGRKWPRFWRSLLVRRGAGPLRRAGFSEESLACPEVGERATNLQTLNSGVNIGQDWLSLERVDLVCSQQLSVGLLMLRLGLVL